MRAMIGLAVLAALALFGLDTFVRNGAQPASGPAQATPAAAPAPRMITRTVALAEAEPNLRAGLAGGLCGLAFLFFLFWTAWKILSVEGDPRSFAYHAGALVACLGLLVHAGVDFNFHIPSNALIFLLQSALATSVFPALPLPRRN